MANESNYGAGAGTAVGGGLGFAFGGPVGAAAGAAIGGGLGGAIGGLFSRAPRTPDISAELDRIAGLYAKARTAAVSSINAQFADRRGQEAANMVTRGVYSSPVSANYFGRLEAQRGQAIANVEGSLAAQQADTEAGLLSKLLGYDFSAREQEAQRRAALFGQLGSLGGSLLSVALSQRPSQEQQWREDFTRKQWYPDLPNSPMSSNLIPSETYSFDRPVPWRRTPTALNFDYDARTGRWK